MTIEHSMYIGPPSFPVFNDQPLPFDPVTRDDIVPFERSDNADMNFAASATWSSNCEWYFVVLPESVALLNCWTRKGLLCKKRSAAFIGYCLDSGILNRSLRKKRAAS